MPVFKKCPPCGSVRVWTRLVSHRANVVPADSQCSVYPHPVFSTFLQLVASMVAEINMGPKVLGCCRSLDSHPVSYF